MSDSISQPPQHAATSDGPEGPAASWPPAPYAPRPDSIWGMLSEEARAVIRQSETEAARLGVDVVTPDALLLSLLGRTGNNACEVLRRLGRDPIEMARELRTLGRSGARQPGPARRRLAGRCVKIVEMAEAEATLLGHRQIGAEHLLIAVVREARTELARLAGGGIAGLPSFAGADGLALDDLRRVAMRVHAEERKPATSLAARIGFVDPADEISRTFLFGIGSFVVAVVAALVGPHGVSIPFSAIAAYCGYRTAALGLPLPGLVLLGIVGLHALASL